MAEPDNQRTVNVVHCYIGVRPIATLVIGLGVGFLLGSIWTHSANKFVTVCRLISAALFAIAGRSFLLVALNIKAQRGK